MDTPLGRDVIMIGTVLVSLIGLFVIRRFVQVTRLRGNNEYTGFVFSFLGVVYGVYLAFTVVVAWEQFTNAEQDAEAEAAHLVELHHDAAGMPPFERQELQQQIERYTRSVIEKEWPAMARREEASIEATVEYNEMWRRYYTVKLNPGSETEAAFFRESVRQLNDLGAARRARLLAARASLPSIMWALLLFGGVGMILFTYLIAAEHVWVQSLVTAFLSAMLAFSILIVAAMEHPFAGEVSVSPEAFQSALRSYKAQRLLMVPPAAAK